MFCFTADPEFPVSKGAARTNKRTKGNIYGNEIEGGRERGREGEREGRGEGEREGGGGGEREKEGGERESEGEGEIGGERVREREREGGGGRERERERGERDTEREFLWLKKSKINRLASASREFRWKEMAGQETRALWAGGRPEGA